MLVCFVTHPEVEVEAAVPVPEWGLSAAGRRRLRRLFDRPWLQPGLLVASSAERKALETAQAIAERVEATLMIEPALGENDRSATGFVPPEEFEELADAFFAHPDRSVRGWETATAAQRRIVRAVDAVLEAADEQRRQTVVIVSHGGVGTLLQCALRGLPIDRRHDQPGQGSFFQFDGHSRRVAHGWRPL